MKCSLGHRQRHLGMLAIAVMILLAANTPAADQGHSREERFFRQLQQRAASILGPRNTSFVGGGSLRTGPVFLMWFGDNPAENPHPKWSAQIVAYSLLDDGPFTGRQRTRRNPDLDEVLNLGLGRDAWLLKSPLRNTRSAENPNLGSVVTTGGARAMVLIPQLEGTGEIAFFASYSKWDARVQGSNDPNDARTIVAADGEGRNWVATELAKLFTLLEETAPGSSPPSPASGVSISNPAPVTPAFRSPLWTGHPLGVGVAAVLVSILVNWPLLRPRLEPKSKQRPRGVDRPPSSDLQASVPILADIAESEGSEKPEISVELIVGSSIRTDSVVSSDNVSRLWGDGVDLLFAGYTVTVESTGWSIDDTLRDPEEFAFTATGTIIKKVENFERFPEILDCAEYHIPTPERRVTVQADWSDEDHDLELSISVTVRLRNSKGASEPCQASARKMIKVIGAKPELSLDASSPAASADGSDKLHIKPTLRLFDTPYPGGIEITEIEEPEKLHVYFDDKKEEFRIDTAAGSHIDPDSEKKIQRLELRCKFHLSDKDIVQFSSVGFPVAFRVRPTGNGYNDEQIGKCFGWMPNAHYRACREHLTSGVRSKDSVKILLKPSRVNFEKADPPSLPSGNEADYKTRFFWTVRSATGEKISGNRILSDSIAPSGPGVVDPGYFRKQWSIQIKFDPPKEAPLSLWDTKPGSLRRDVDNVDEEGRLMFVNKGESIAQPFCEYDHWEEFYDQSTRYLHGQCCTIKAAPMVGDIELTPAELFIGPPCKLYIYVDTGEGEVIGHVYPGLIDENGRYLRAGHFLANPIAGVDPVTGTAFGAVGGAMLAGLAIQALSYLVAPQARAALLAFKVLRIAATSLGGASGLIYVESVGGRGALRDDNGHGFNYCRGWDISKKEYWLGWAMIQHWKQLSDRNELFYDGTCKVPKSSGNCWTFSHDVFTAVGIPLPNARDWDFSRPLNVGDAIVNDLRTEMNQGVGSAGFKHPWIYGPGKRPSAINMDSLSTRQPPAS